MTDDKTKKVAEYKKIIVADLADNLRSHPIIGLVNMENLPAPQLQRMRAKLRQNFTIAMTKKRLITLAISQAKGSKPGLEKLIELMTGMPALIFTKENPFKLANTLAKSKTPAPAKSGQIAPKDIVIPPGPTPFAPGPIISELSGVGIKTGVDAGKVTIKQEFVAAKAGTQISPKVADVLTKLGVEPMEVGLNLVAVYENGSVYGHDVLSLDQDTFLRQLAAAASDSFALALYIGYVAKETVALLVAKAFFEASHLAELSKVASSEEAPAGEKETAATEKTETAPEKEDAFEEKREMPSTPEAETEVKEGKPAPGEVKETAKTALPAAEAEEAETGEQIKEKIKKEGNKPEADIKGKVKTKISEDFKGEVAEEKARRQKVDTKEIENLAQKLKKKGTFREG